MFRLLVTGSRLWSDLDRLRRVLILVDEHFGSENVVLVVGDCSSGADKMAALVAGELGWKVEVFCADWESFGRRAGFLRNKAMVDSGVDFCFGFVSGESRGTKLTLGLAEQAGVHCKVFSE